MKAAVLHGAGDIRIESYRQPELGPGMVLLFALEDSVKALHLAADKSLALKVQIKP